MSYWTSIHWYVGFPFVHTVQATSRNSNWLCCMQFTEAKVYHNKLVNIRKEMIAIHEKTTKLKVSQSSFVQKFVTGCRFKDFYWFRFFYIFMYLFYLFIFQKRALKLQQQKQKEFLETEQQREKELERERQLIAKPAKRNQHVPSLLT